MNVFRKAGAVALIILVLVTAVSPAAAQVAPTTPTVGDTWELNVTANLGIRNDHSLDAQRLGEFPDGTQIVVTDVYTSGNYVWVEHTTNDLTGWTIFKDDTYVYMVFVSHGEAPTDNDGYGLTQNVITDIIEAAGSDVSAALDVLDERFEEAWFIAGVGHRWSRADVVAGNVEIGGPSYYWTDHLNHGIPAGAQPVLVQGQWGVFFVPEDVNIEILLPNGGGRWVEITDVVEPIVNGESECVALVDLQSAVSAMTDPQDVINYMDQTFVHQVNPYFRSGTTITVEAGEVLVIWTNWGEGNTPANAEPLTSDSTEGGWGVWLFNRPTTITTTNGGGMVSLCADQS